MSKAWLGLGANLGAEEADNRGSIALAVARLASAGVRVLKRSSDWRTPPWGPVPQSWYVNACIAVETALDPSSLLRRCLSVERTTGRVRTERWGPRLIDIDVLAYGDLVLNGPDLVLPHPRLMERVFVLVPLAETALNLAIDGVRVADAAALVDRNGVERID